MNREEMVLARFVPQATGTVIQIGAPDYIIYFDSASSSYKSLNTHTGTVTSNSSEVGALFNTAITALTTNGGWIHFKGNLNVTTSIIMKSNIKITGDGRAGSVLRLGNAQNKEVIISDSFGTLTGTNTSGFSSGPALVELEDFAIDGNKTNQTVATNCYGIRKYGYSWKLKNIHVVNCKADGIYTEWSTDAACPSGFDCMEDSWLNVDSLVNDGAGITFRGPHDSVLKNVKCYSNGTDGFVCQVSATYSGQCYINGMHNFSNGQLTGQTSKNMWVTGSGNNVVFTDLTVETQTGVGGYGLLVDSSAVCRGSQLLSYNCDIGIKTATGGIFEGSSVYVTSAYSEGVHFGGANESQLTGGVIENVTGNGAGTGYGLIIADNNSFSRVTGLVTYACKTAMINWVTSTSAPNILQAVVYQSVTYPTVLVGTPDWQKNNINIKCFSDAATTFRHENSGLATFSGTGSTIFTIPHGLFATPNIVNAVPNTVDARGNFMLTADATNVTITYVTAPLSGSSNVKLYWTAKMSA